MERRREIINSDLIEKLSSLGCVVLKDEPLSKHTSFKIGGVADFFVEVGTEKALQVLLKDGHIDQPLLQRLTPFRQLRCHLPRKGAGEKMVFLGGGTNVLFSDEGFRGVVVKLVGDFEKISFEDDYTQKLTSCCFRFPISALGDVEIKLTCGAGALLPLVVKMAAEKDLLGLECCAGIPGTVGGAVFGNAGSKDFWIDNAIESVEVFIGGKKKTLKRKKIGFEYRKSGLENCVITKVNFSLKKNLENDTLSGILKSIDRRKQTQPLGKPNAGCIFKNTKDFSAGKLIDDLGLKGKTVGGAQISQEHANFIVNTGNAKASDVLELIKFIKDKVKDKHGIDLETEIKIIS